MSALNLTIVLARAALAMVCLGVTASVWATAPAPGKYRAQFCAVPPTGQAICHAASVDLSATGMEVRTSREWVQIKFGEPQLEVRARQAGKPPAHFYADYRWSADSVLRYNETQPTQWEVRLGAPR